MDVIIYFTCTEFEKGREKKDVRSDGCAVGMNDSGANGAPPARYTPPLLVPRRGAGQERAQRDPKKKVAEFCVA